MDSVNDPAVQSTCLMWASQLGKTEVVNNVIGYFIDADASPILMVQPTLDLAESWSKIRLAPMLRDCPCFRGKVRDARTRDSGNTILNKSYTGGDIVATGANAPGGLAGRPRRVVLLDEIDRFPASAGTEGDPCLLAERRTESFWNAVLFKTSTPTVKGFSRIEIEFEQTDQRRWFCPCPKCGAYQTLKWSQVQWGQKDGPLNTPKDAEGEEGEKDGSDARYVCEGCKAELSDEDRVRMVKAGEWRATAPFKGKRGYHLNGIASPFKAKKGFKSRLHQMVAGFLEAKRGGRETFKTWVNTFLGESFEEAGERIEHGELLARSEGYGPEKLPDQVLLVGAGVDVQGDRLELEAVGIGEDDETWGIEARRFFGDTEQDEVWQDLGQYLGKKFTREDGAVLAVTFTAIDMRHKAHKVRRFVLGCGLPRVYPIYGVGGRAPIMVTTRFNKHYRLRTYAVNTKMAKDILFARLRVAEAGPRHLHFPKGHGYDEEFFQQLTAEVLKTRYSRGFPEQFYEKVRDRNEALDRRVYFLAGVDILKPNLTAIARHLKVNKEGKTAESPKEYQLKPPGENTPAPNPLPKERVRRLRPGGGFVGGWRK